METNQNMDGSNEFYSTRLRAGRRTYFFNVKMTKKGEKYMVLNEIRKKDDGSFERTRIMIFEEDIYGFLNKFKETFDVMTSGTKGEGEKK